MKHFLYTLVLLSLFSCQKENNEEKQPVDEVGTPITPACNLASLREYPSVDGNNLMRSFVYDAQNRVVKMDVQSGTSAAITKTIVYNAAGRIDTIRQSSGAYEKFVYDAAGTLTAWEAFGAEGNGVKKSGFSYDNGKLVREDRYQHNGTAYALTDYLAFEWDANGNITAIKTYDAAQVLKATDTYVYDTEKLNRQQTVTPQMNLLFRDWSNDITAFINSKNLLKQVVSKERSLVYEINAAGVILSVKGSRKENYFAFTYSCK